MAKTIDIVVPDLGDFENVDVIEILVGKGDTVERESGLITLETGKRRHRVAGYQRRRHGVQWRCHWQAVHRS